MPICNRCNNNDTRNISQMMEEEWGSNHINTKRVHLYLELAHKKFV